MANLKGKVVIVLLLGSPGESQSPSGRSGLLLTLSGAAGTGQGGPCPSADLPTPAIYCRSPMDSMERMVSFIVSCIGEILLLKRPVLTAKKAEQQRGLVVALLPSASSCSRAVHPSNLDLCCFPDNSVGQPLLVIPSQVMSVDRHEQGLRGYPM